jgi:hypothetical protein
VIKTGHDETDYETLFIFSNPFVLPFEGTNGTGHIRHQCRKTTVLSCHICLLILSFNTGVEKMNYIEI